MLGISDLPLLILLHDAVSSLVYFLNFIRQLQSSHVRPVQLVVPCQGTGGRGGRGQGDCIYGERGQGEDPEHQLQ